MVVELNAEPYAWMVTFVEPAPGSIDELSVDGSTLTASGTAYLNDPIDPNLSPFALLPEAKHVPAIPAERHLRSVTMSLDRTADPGESVRLDRPSQIGRAE